MGTVQGSNKHVKINTISGESSESVRLTVKNQFLYLLIERAIEPLQDTLKCRRLL